MKKEEVPMTTLCEVCQRFFNTEGDEKVCEICSKDFVPLLEKVDAMLASLSMQRSGQVEIAILKGIKIDVLECLLRTKKEIKDEAYLDRNDEWVISVKRAHGIITENTGCPSLQDKRVFGEVKK